MMYSFWNMITGDALFAEIDKLKEGRQKRFFLMIAEEALAYNIKYETSFTFAEFKTANYPSHESYFSHDLEEENDD